MSRGLYRVPVRVSDLQDKGGVHEVQVRVCRCLGEQCAPQRSSATLGVWGVLAMLLALLLLLLLCEWHTHTHTHDTHTHTYTTKTHTYTGDD